MEFVSVEFLYLWGDLIASLIEIAYTEVTK